MTINTSYDACRKLVYDLNDLPTQTTTANPFTNLPAEIAIGTPLFIGAPKLISKLNFSKPYSVWQQMKAKPNMTWNQSWEMITKQNTAAKEAAKKATAHLKDPNSFLQTIKNKHQYGNLKTAGADISKNAKYYKEAQRLINEAKTKKMTGAKLKQQLAKIREAMAKGDIKLNAANALSTPTTRAGKLAHGIKTKTGYYKAKGKILSNAKYGTRAAAGMRTASKAVKGSGWMALIQGAVETPDIVNAYKIDTKTGNKQLAKSATKVGTSVLGYAAGAAAAGAVAGTVVPGIGNVAGAVVGFVGGLIGGAIASWSAGKIWDSCNGKGSYDKTEVEIAMAKQADAKAFELSQSADGKEALLAEANEQLIDEEGNILGDEETLEAYEYLLAEYYNGSADNSVTTQASQHSEYQQAEIDAETQAFIKQLEAWG